MSIENFELHENYYYFFFSFSFSVHGFSLRFNIVCSFILHQHFKINATVWQGIKLKRRSTLCFINPLHCERRIPYLPLPLFVYCILFYIVHTSFMFEEYTIHNTNGKWLIFIFMCGYENSSSITINDFLYLIVYVQCVFMLCSRKSWNRI